MKKRLLALLLAVMVVASCLTIGAAADDFTPRTTAPDSNNEYYYSNINPFYAAGGLVGQCTWYAFGRAYEILGTYPNLSRGNAINWYNFNVSNGYYSYGSEPRVGAIVCYDNSPNGHVAVVEEIIDGVAYISEYNVNSDKSFHYGKRTVNSWREPVGYIYLIDDPTPTKPDAPSANVVTINYAAETISYDSGLYEVSATNFGSVIASGGSISGVIDGVATNIYVRVKAQGNTPPSDATAVRIPGRSSSMYMDMVDYVNEVFNTDTGNQYSLNGTTWIDCTGKTPISVAEGYESIYIRDAATSSSFASNAATITVPTRGAAPTGLGKTDETVDQRDDGTITGVTSAMEYRVSGGSWADCPDGTITGLADGTYEVRYMATSGALASESASVVIAQGVPQTFTLEIAAPEFDDVIYNYAQPDSKPLVITSSGNTDSTITGVTADSESFIIGTGSKTVPYGQSISDWTIQPVAGLAAGTYTATVTVTYNGGATASDTVSFVVEKAPQAAPGAPEIAKRGYTSIELKALPANENGAVAQYRIDGGEWQFSPVFEKLSPGRSYTFEQRYAPVGSYLASPASAAVKFQTLFNIPDTYPITIEDTANGEVDTSLSNASRGSVITVTVDPDEGYSLGSLTVTGPDGRLDVTRVNATTYRFTMPEGEVTVRAAFTRGGLPFTDVAVNAWYYDAVSYAYTNGLMDGVSATAFNPDGNMTRAMVWAILARVDGETVTGSDWVSEARAWAMAEEVSDGTEPNAFVTREQLVTMLWRYAGEPAVSGGLSSWRDAASVSDWAQDAMVWALDEGIITGVTAVTLDPQGTATRAQCAAILMRYAENV